MTTVTRRGLLTGLAGTIAGRKKRRRPTVGMQPDQQGVFFQVIIQGGGEFTYDAAGNLRTANVGQTVTDPIQGITCYAGFSTFNGHGAVISLFSSTLDAQLWYADTGSSTQGALTASIATASGTDPFANAFQAGITTYVSGTLADFVNTQNGAITLGHVGDNGGPAQITENPAGTLTAIPGRLTISDTPVWVEWLSAQASPNAAAQLVVAAQAATPTPVTAALSEIQGDGRLAQILALIATGAGQQVLGMRQTGDTNDRLAIASGGAINWGPGNAATDTVLQRVVASRLDVQGADFTVRPAGRGLRVVEGSNAKQGTATLAGGTILVANTAVTANSRIFVTPQDNATIGALRISARVAGTSFTITSSNAGDSGVVAYEIFEPG